MAKDTNSLDGLIDEALECLTSGRPRTGFRGRVLARIGEERRQASVARITFLGWRVRPFQLAAASIILACGLAAALIVPALLPAGGPVPAESETAASPSAVAPQPAGAASREANVPGELQAAELTPPPQARRRPAVRRESGTVQADPVASEADMIPWVRVDPLPDPNPIVVSPIELAPIAIEPLVIQEIQVEPLDAGIQPQGTNRRSL